MICGHSYNEAIAVLFWPVLAISAFVLLLAVMYALEKKHQLRVAHERNRRLQIQLNAWKEN